MPTIQTKTQTGQSKLQLGVNGPSLGYRIGTSDRPLGDATSDPEGFIVLNTTNGNTFKVSGGIWVTGGTFPVYLYDNWLASTPAVATGTYRVGNSDRSGATSTPNNFIVINQTNSKVFQVSGGSWVDVTSSFSSTTLNDLVNAWNSA